MQDSSLRMNGRVWTDSLLSQTEQQQRMQEGDPQQQQAASNTPANGNSSSRLGSWDYSMPGRSLKARSRVKNSTASRDKLKEHHQRVRFNARHPFHRRKKGSAATVTEVGDSEELGWTLEPD